MLVLCGSIYLIMATNIGARLGFLVTFAGLTGWLFLMGIIWSFYGIGLKGPEPSWEAVPGQTVLQDPSALTQAGVFDSSVEIPEGASYRRAGRDRRRALRRRRLGAAGGGRPGVRPGQLRGGVLLEETGAFAAGEFRDVNVFDIGGERYPKINDSLDFLAFFHEPHFARRRGRPAHPDARRARPGAGRRRSSTRPASTSTCTWSATSAPGASRRPC